MSKIDLDMMEKLIDLMVDNELSELHYRQGELEIELKRGGSTIQTVATHAVVPAMAQALSSTPAVPSEAEPAETDEHAGLVPITSPMVGTFYAAPDPDSPSFATVGSSVGQDTTVCIIEAMKVFNEIKAEVDGTIVKVVASNAQPVEFGEVLFYVKPN